ncbi:MAG: hydroxymethylglutaryl-CoA synthase [Candidatus Helarchaeota archaeon]|nr:hydroxymethylglutaryl-CoA synthase [Candidatus Helarchaeota archaeon]
MVGIVGYGIYIPYYRLKISDIAQAWLQPRKIPGEKAIPAIDEDIFPLGLNAARNAMTHAGIDPGLVGLVYFCTFSSPLIEGAISNQLAYALGCKENITPADFGASPRASTLALQSCVDALNAGRSKAGVIVAADCLSAHPGSELDYTASSGAGSLILGNNGVIAEILDIESYSTTFREKWRHEGADPTMGDGRFVRGNAIKIMSTTVQNSLKKTGFSVGDFNHVIFQQSGPAPQRWISDMAKRLKISKEQLAKGLIFSNFGDTGSASVLIGLASVLDNAKAGEKILCVSFGSGGSDAITLEVKDAIEEKKGKITSVKHFIEDKEYIDYFTSLRYNKLIKRG